MRKHQIIIIGGGAAGFFCAANLDPQKFDVTILEQNSDVLQKVKVSGGGRCNVTHACFDPKELVGYYPRGHKELLSVFHKFQPGDTMEWFESRGVPLKIEADNRIFPESNSSQSIISCLVKEVQANGFKVVTGSAVTKITRPNGGYLIESKTGQYTADSIIFTPGSAPKSLKLIEDLGHKLIPVVPSLFTFNIQDELLKDLPGTSFADAEVSIPSMKISESGPMLITHWGLSGPAILKISAWKARELFAAGYSFEIVVNFINSGIEQAEEEFQKIKKENPKRSVGQSKISNVTNRFWLKILEISGVNPEKQVAQLSTKELQAVLKNLCEKRFLVTGKSTNKDEFVTAGGVNLKEINFKNMASKILPNFYIAGEVLNVDAVTGGFNFQACWSEAWLIAQHLNGSEI